MKASYLIASGLVIITGFWLLSGIVFQEEATAVQPATTTVSNNPMIVEAQWMIAESITPFIISHGELAPDRVVNLKTETSGQVESIAVREGGIVTAGQILLQLKVNDKLVRQEQAELTIIERQNRLSAIKKLADQGFVSSLEVEAAQLEVKKAEVELAQVQLEIQNTSIKAPFDGILEELEVEIGEYLGVGASLLTLVDNDPLVVRVQVPQQNINSLSLGQKVRIVMNENQEVSGDIRFIASRGDDATRTFRVEIEIPNEGKLRAGSTATAYIPRQAIDAHFISGGLLSLNTAGQMGVKTVNPEGLVSFHPVELEYADADGMWVSGLPENALVITSGQGFADEGQIVIISNAPINTVSEQSIQSSAIENTPSARIN